MHGPKKIPYSIQWIDEKDIEQVIKVLRSDWITQGPKIEGFEKAIAAYCGAKYAVAVNSGTSALVASCFAAGIKEGDEVITTPYTFAASANCILWFKALPVFVDIDEKTLNIDPAKIEKAITPRTKAILTVDFAGLPADYDVILKIAKKYNLIVIDDAAHALGAEYHGRKMGSVADITCFSFHPVKTITTGEGGMVVTNNRKFYEKVFLFRNHGITKNPKQFLKKDGAWYYEMRQLGLNLRMTDFQAALGISQLKKIEKFVQKRREIAKIYNLAFPNLPIILPAELKNSKSAWHLYPIRLKLEKLKVSGKKIFEELQKAGLGVQVHYIPVYYHPYFSQLGFKRGLCPVAESVYEREISIPIYPSMTKEDVGHVIKTINKVIKKASK